MNSYLDFINRMVEIATPSADHHYFLWIYAEDSLNQTKIIVDAEDFTVQTDTDARLTITTQDTTLTISTPSSVTLSTTSGMTGEEQTWSLLYTTGNTIRFVIEDMLLTSE